MPDKHLDWTTFKARVNQRGLKIQYEDLGTRYSLWTLDKSFQYKIVLYKESGNPDTDDFETNYKPTSNEAFPDLDVNVENDIIVEGFGSGASLDTNATVEGEVTSDGNMKIFTDPDQSGDPDKGPVSINEKSGGYFELAVTDEDAHDKLDLIKEAIDSLDIESNIYSQSVQIQGAWSDDDTKINYTVPVGKKLYITSISCTIYSGQMMVEWLEDTTRFYIQSLSDDADTNPTRIFPVHNPLGSFSAGTVITAYRFYGDSGKDWSCHMTGYLEDV